MARRFKFRFFWAACILRRIPEGICVSRALLLICLSVAASPIAAFELNYGGRLTSPVGEPLAGPVDITFRFYRESSGGEALVTVSSTNVALVDGVFQATLPLTPEETDLLFQDGVQAVYIEVAAQGKTFARQRFSYAPLALRVPVDGSKIVYDTSGRLTLGPGVLSALTPVTSVNGRTGSVSLETDDIAETSSRKYFSPSLARQAFSSTGLIGYNSSAGVFTLSDTVLTKGGGSMTGSLDFGSAHKVTNLPDPALPSDATRKSYVDTKLGGHPLDVGSPSLGQVIKWDGTKFVSAPDALGEAGGGIASLNSLSASSQSLSVEIPGVVSGTRPSWSAVSATSTHALTIPMASASGVTAGLISKSEYDLFGGKQDGITSSSNVNGGTFFTNKQNGLELKPYGTASSNTGELRFSELTAGGAHYVGFKAPDAIASSQVWTLPSVDGAIGSVLSTDGSGILAWMAIPSAPLVSVAGRTGAVTLSHTDISGLGALAALGAVSGGTGGQITDGSITDVDISGTAAIADSKLATISSAAKVANSATTATSANAAGAIVARDASGNFTAGTITATFNGNATNVSGTVAVANGGTGATTAAGARTNLGAAASGTNGDITSLTGLTTPLSEAQGGTGASTAQPFFVLAGPGVGPTAGAPAFRALLAADIPSLDASKITSGTLSNSLINWAAAPVTTVSGRTGAVTLSSTDISGLSSLATANAVSGGSGGTIADDSITNADINSGAAIADTKLATIATAGKVANSATTATSANTNGAIVARDASGNFTAGTITATLNGNATNVTGTVALANGGTGATTAAGARTNLGAAASGANTDITSLTNLTSLTTTGNVGIGSGTPNFRLDVAASGAGMQTVERLQNTVAATVNSGAQTVYSANRTTNGLTDVAAIGGTITDISASAYKGALVFSTANNAAPAERMRIDANGNVGIGTTSPAASLDVAGSIKIGTTAAETCTSADQGRIRYSSIINNIQFCNGTNWTDPTPTGAVMAFNLGSCPSGWSEYTPAYGRFIRGIDKSGTNIDASGQRAPGDVQSDMLASHTHSVQVSRQLAGIDDQNNTSQTSKGDNLTADTTNWTTTATGGTETRPKNVALLYCQKN